MEDLKKEFKKTFEILNATPCRQTAENAVKRFAKFVAEKLNHKLNSVSEKHPYKERGNRDSYSQYNEGWSDACDVMQQEISNFISDLKTLKTKK